MTIFDRENWMSCLDKSVKLIDTFIPASHDASSYPTTNIAATTVAEMMGALCQLEGYTAQLNAGVRYFDMRVVRSNNELHMHHSFLTFEKFDDVMIQIKNFSELHKGEYIFMDLDFDDHNLGDEIISTILKHIPENRISTAHLSNGKFNPNVTWNDLGDTRFLITWSKDDSTTKPWLGLNDNFRNSFYAAFNKKEPQEILQDISHEINNNWQKDRLFVSQCINTPLASPLTPPDALDADAQEEINNWITKNLPFQERPPVENPYIPNNEYERRKRDYDMLKESYDALRSLSSSKNLNIIMRDFVNARYNRSIIDLIIKANSFSRDPYIPLGEQISNFDTVRLRTEHGKYLSVSQYPSDDAYVTLVDKPDEHCNFIIRNQARNDRGPVVYSGNLSANTVDCTGNFRLVPNFGNNGLRNPDDSTMVLTVNNGGKNYKLRNGMDWGSAYDQETFTFFNPDDLKYSPDIDPNYKGVVWHGSRVIIRSSIGFLRSKLEKAFKELFFELPEDIFKLVPFNLAGAFLKAYDNDPGKQNFLVVITNLSGETSIDVASPGPDYATTFIIEKVS